MEPADMSLPTVLRSNLIVCITSCCCFFSLAVCAYFILLLMSMLMYVDLISLISTDVCLLLNIGVVCLYFISILIIS